MTISLAIITALAVSVLATTTGTDLATNSTITLILLIALIALAGVTSTNYCCRNRIISDSNTITQTLF